MSADALVSSPWRAALVLPGGSEPLSPRTLLIQGLDDLGSPSVLDAKASASPANDWREVLRDLHPFRYEDMTISLGSPGMPSRGAAGWLSPVVLDADSMAEAQTAHHVKFPVSMISSRPIGSQPFMLGPPPKSPARRTKLRSDEEQEVADILVMLRSRSAQPRAAPPDSSAAAPQDSPAATAPNSPDSAAAPLGAGLTPAPTPTTLAPADADADASAAEDFKSEVELDVQMARDAAAADVKHVHKKLVRDAEWKPHVRADARPRRRTKAKRQDDDEDADAQDYGGARSVDQSNELEKMLRDIGFMAIRTERTSISCSLCQQRFPSRMFAVRHAQRDHLGVKPFECNICHMRFVRLDSVPRHIKNVHQRKTTKRKRKRSNKS